MWGVMEDRYEGSETVVSLFLFAKSDWSLCGLWRLHDFVICSEHREQVEKLFSSTYSEEHSSRANKRDTDRKVKFQGVEVLTMGKYEYMRWTFWSKSATKEMKKRV